MRVRLLAAAALLALSAPAQAQTREATPACGPRLMIEYTDDGPDVFLIRNLSGEGWALEALSIDLSGSAGDVVFDTVFGGEGAGSPSPFQSLPGEGVRLVAMTPASDGGRLLALRFAGFAPGARFTVSVDIDDRLPNSAMGQSYVTGPELAGAHALARFVGPTGAPSDVSAVFDTEAVADSGAGGCV